MSVHLRTSRVPFRFSGPDAAKLLNDVLTGTFESDAAKPHWWALLSPQGKIQAEGLSGWADDGFWLDVHADVADAFFKRMKLYRLRAAVEIDNMAGTHVVGWSETDPGGVSHIDPRNGELGWRVIATSEDAKAWPDTDEARWRTVRIAAGVTELGIDYPVDTHFPHDVGMDLLGGIDFAKGCYVGQEVVSRMKHRGTARRRPVIVSGASLEAGAPIMAGEREAGHLGAVQGDTGVAIVRLDRVADPGAVSVNGSLASLVLPAWASYDFGDSGGGE